MSENQQKPGSPPQGFEQIDADAVCQQCGSVNEEGTLLCKVCGNNLRDQRARRIAMGTAPELVDDGPDKFRMLTGLLITLGILLVVYLVLNIATIEDSVKASLSAQGGVDTDFWGGADAPMYEEMLDLLETNPSPRALRQAALDEPIAETAYNGRYILLPPGELRVSRIVGEAVVQRRGERMFFVMVDNVNQLEIRGFATFETFSESSELRPFVRNTAGIRYRGETYTGMGVTQPKPAGGHTILVQSTMEGDRQREFLAYRLP